MKNIKYENIENKIHIIKPTLDNLEDVISVEKAAWPDIGEGMVAEYDKFKNRIELDLMYLLYFDGKPSGIISFQHPSFTNQTILDNLLKKYNKEGLLKWADVISNYNLPEDWYAATNNGYIQTKNSSTNDPSSEHLFLIGVGVDSNLKGNGLVNYLIDHTIKEAKKMNKKFILGYGRLPQLHEKYDNATIKNAESHLSEKKPGTNLPADYGARFHVYNGAKAISVIPNAMDDPESLNYGFLALYKL